MKKLLAALLALAMLLSVCAFAEETKEEGKQAETIAEEELGSLKNPIPAGEEFTLTTEIREDGTARTDKTGTAEKLKITVKVTDWLQQEYYQEKYSFMYKLTGTEACAVLEMTMLESGDTKTIIPQDVLLIRMADAEGNIFDGYQMMDAEISGNYDVELGLNEARSFYKRYVFDAETPMAYVVVTSYRKGKAEDTYFLLENPVVYETLTNGAHSEEVRVLQQKLIDMGYLTGKADGIFGARTEQAIKEVQEKAGMEATGVADNEFQHYLYD